MVVCSFWPYFSEWTFSSHLVRKTEQTGFLSKYNPRYNIKERGVGRVYSTLSAGKI